MSDLNQCEGCGRPAELRTSLYCRYCNEFPKSDCETVRQVVNGYLIPIPGTGLYWEYLSFNDGTLYRRRQDASGGPCYVDTDWKQVNLPKDGIT